MKNSTINTEHRIATAQKCIVQNHLRNVTALFDDGNYRDAEHRAAPLLNGFSRVSAAAEPEARN